MADRKSDAVRIRHMADAARKAIRFTQSKKRIDLDTEEQLALALVRLVEIIGEAASKVTDGTKVQFSAIPWKNIIGTRHRIIHAYENVDYDILWQIVHTDLPILIQQLEEILQSLDWNNQKSMF
jgi:uncharacterized protein with HEPN domain